MNRANVLRFGQCARTVYVPERVSVHAISVWAGDVSHTSAPSGWASVSISHVVRHAVRVVSSDLDAVRWRIDWPATLAFWLITAILLQ